MNNQISGPGPYSSDYDNVLDIRSRFKLGLPSSNPSDNEPSLKGGGGDGTSGGMNDAWKTSVETQLGQLHGDIRMLLGMGIGAVGLVLAAFALAYVSLSGSVASVQSEQAKATTRLDGIDKRLDSMDQKLDRILDKMDSKAK